MTSPVSAIEAIARTVALDIYHNAVDSDDASHSMDMPVAVALITDAMSPLVRQAEARTGIDSAHDLISDWLGEGTDDLPDDTPVRIEIGKRITIADNLGSLRRARALLGGENAE